MLRFVRLVSGKEERQRSKAKRNKIVRGASLLFFSFFDVEVIGRRLNRTVTRDDGRQISVQGVPAEERLAT